MRQEPKKAKVPTTGIPCPLEAGARRHPDRTAVRSEDLELTYGELNGRVCRAGAELQWRSGGAAGRICLHRVGDIDALAWLFAALRAGKAAVFPGDREPIEAVRALGSSGVFEVLISRTESAGDEMPGVVFVEGDVSSLPGFDARAVPASGTRLSRDAVATWIRTSGSTGRPRFAVHTVGALVASARASNERIALHAGDVWLMSLPVFHVGGLAVAFRAFLAGATVAIPQDRGDPAAAIRTLGPTHVSLVATQLRRLLKSDPTAPPNLSCVLVGGGPVDAPLIRRAVAGGYPVRTTYGMTEFASQITTSEVWRQERNVYSAGRPLAGLEVHIASDAEIFVRGASAFSGYAEGNAVDSPAQSGGWLATGDLGAMEGEELYVRGRKDTMFISGGENIQPEEIERALRNLDEIEDALVVDVPDAEFGRRPVAYVRRGAPISDEIIRSRLQTHLPAFKIPDAILDWPEGPDGERMKADRSGLRARACVRFRPEKK